MKNIIHISLLFIFSACSQTTYKNMYDTQYSVLGSSSQNTTEVNVHTMENGENPLKRPSYDEYRK